MSTFRNVLNNVNRVASLAAFILGIWMGFNGDYAHAAYLASIATFGTVVAGQSDD